MLAKHSFRRSSSDRTCVSMASCNAAVPLLDNSAEALRSRFCFQSRIACLVAVWASDAALTYVFMQASAIEHVVHSCEAAALETSKMSVAGRTFIAFPRYWPLGECSAWLGLFATVAAHPTCAPRRQL